MTEDRRGRWRELAQLILARWQCRMHQPDDEDFEKLFRLAHYPMGCDEKRKKAGR